MGNHESEEEERELFSEQLDLIRQVSVVLSCLLLFNFIMNAWIEGCYVEDTP